MKPWAVVNQETQISVEHFDTKEQASRVAAEMTAYHHRSYVVVSLIGVDVEAELVPLLIACDSELSAIGHGRPSHKEDCLTLSGKCRALVEKLNAR